MKRKKIHPKLHVTGSLIITSQKRRCKADPASALQNSNAKNTKEYATELSNFNTTQTDNRYSSIPSTFSFSIIFYAKNNLNRKRIFLQQSNFSLL